jgi:hypothetical protein
LFFKKEIKNIVFILGRNYILIAVAIISNFQILYFLKKGKSYYHLLYFLIL